MLLWSIVVLLLIVTLAAILYPLYRGRDTLDTREAFDANIYKDQLTTIDRELEEGQIEKEDAASARIEISRKLLAAADQAEKHPSMKAQDRQLSRFSTFALALGIPLLAIGLYLQVGSPNLPDQPLVARAKTVPAKGKIAELIARAEQRLVAKPEDGNGWEIMAPIYLRHEMYGKAANAYKNAMRLLGTSAERLSGLADSIILANNNIVSDEVLPVLKRAIKADPNHPKPHFWIGLYHEQHNKFKQAEDVYAALLKKSGEHASWRPMVEARYNDMRKKQGLPESKIALAKAVPPQSQPKIKLGDALKAEDKQHLLKGPTADDIKRAGEMSADDRQTMITTMVEGLSERLHEEGGDLASWMRLVNVLNVLGRKDEAKKAVLAGKKNLKSNKQAVAQLAALANKLGLGS